MKERPILFSGPMVRAILEGRKTQTRRVVKFTPSGTVKEPGGHRRWHPADPEAVLACPFGGHGDRLWVRESGWERPVRTDKMMREGADTWERYYFDADGEADRDDMKAWGFKRRPSIFMPRWASRITLEVVSVRVERLQEISEAEALAEAPIFTEAAKNLGRNVPVAVSMFAHLWDSINGKRAPWQSNPCVWVVEFRIKP